MEMNQNNVQEQPAQQHITDTAATCEAVPSAAEQTTAAEQSAAAGSAADSCAPLSGNHPHYNQGEAKAIVNYLTKEGFFDPEYILLFGSLAGGTMHSEAKCYDLLLVVQDLPAYGWQAAKRDLRYKVPFRWREITYTNLYVCPWSYIESHRTPFLYFAHRQGVLLYCKESFYFRRPKRPCNFAAAYCDAKSYFDTFRPVADLLMNLAQAGSPQSPCEIRWAAFMTAKAAILYYRVLYYVYHNEPFDQDDPIILHERMRTLSTELMLLFDDTSTESNRTLACLRSFGMKAFADRKFTLHPFELREHMARVVCLGEIVTKYCTKRLELYSSLKEE